MKSKKQSAASSKSERRNRPTLFLDRSLGRHQVASALRSAGAIIQLHDSHFAPDCPDEEWLREVGSRGWAVLTKDARIRYRPNERSALERAGVIAFVLTAGNLTGSEMAKVFVKALARIERAATSVKSPALFTFGRSGRLQKTRF